MTENLLANLNLQLVIVDTNEVDIENCVGGPSSNSVSMVSFVHSCILYSDSTQVIL